MQASLFHSVAEALASKRRAPIRVLRATDEQELAHAHLTSSGQVAHASAAAATSAAADTAAPALASAHGRVL
eukprot:6204800-Pleurochrysis_carterae.AAC.2